MTLPLPSSRVASCLAPCVGKTWVRRMAVTMSGNLLRSHQPKMRASCLYQRYRHRSCTPNSPLRFHRLGRGCAKSVPASKSCTARAARSSETPCRKNQVRKSDSKRMRSALLSQELLLSMRSTRCNELGTENTVTIYSLKKGIGQSAAYKTWRSKSGTPFPPSHKTLYHRRGGHNRWGYLYHIQIASATTSGWHSTKDDDLQEP